MHAFANTQPHPTGLPSTLPPDWPVYRLHTPQGDTAIVSQHGAQVLSWRTADGTERLFLSPAINWQDVARQHCAIRGGIPICWPQFNRRGKLPKHGFARLLPWTLVEQDAHSLRLRNTGQRSLSFTTALHGYLAVPAIRHCAIHGAHGQTYWNAIPHANPTHPVQYGPIDFNGEVDRVYPAFAATLTDNHAPTLCSRQSPTLEQTVVWNPGAKLCAQLADLQADSYQRFVCVEAAHIDTPVSLPPGAVWQGWQMFQAFQAHE